MSAAIEDCQECRSAAAHAYSDATTPGFFKPRCLAHSERRVCEFCPAIGVHRCAWPELKEVPIALADLHVGDYVRFNIGPPRRVTEVARSFDRKTTFWWLEGLSAPGSYTVGTHVEPRFLGRRMMPCAAACCDLCAVERADGVHACRDHWMDWSKIA